MDENDLRPDSMPRHVAVIMDGNGRWATRRGASRVEGHRAGLDSCRAVLRAASDLGIEYLTLYAFSLENWNRPKAEVRELMHLLETYLDEEIEEVDRNGVRVLAIGRNDRLPPSVRRRVEAAVERTKDNREMTLIFALSYSGRAEIVDAAKKLARDVEEGRIDPDRIDEKVFASYLYAPDVPDPDLLIRTGAEMRVSNFLLWQIAYAEIYTTSMMWPDFRKEHLVDAIGDYQRRERRFGMTSAQVSESTRGDD
jgi:undecaprenyl diphosphate synthase